MDSLLLFLELNGIPLLCVIVGLVLVIVEMSIPGFGVPGIIGVILLAVGVILYAETPIKALIMIIIILAILGAALTLILKSASKGGLSKRLVLSNSLGDEIKFSEEGDLDYFIGSEGTALTVLRPSGIADFSGIKLDVVSEGEFIPRDSAVVIIKVEGNRVVVKQKPKI